MTTLPKTNAWVIFPKPNPEARLRLFCFPYAGGGASIFRTWPSDLPAAIEVCAIQLPGRENRLREQAFTHLTPLVETLAQVLRPYLSLPFAFFGHSMGTLIGFELAREFRRQRLPSPLHLLVSGRRAPQLLDDEPPIHDLPEPEFVAELRRLSGTPEAVLQNAELMQLLIPVLRSDFAINETYTYTPEEPLGCPISAFGGTEDEETTQEDLAAWREQTRVSFRLQMFPGDHFFLNSIRTPFIQALAQDLYRYL
jgi:medium-chain acyl-[acyl-carrier-protein] hydrolase